MLDEFALMPATLLPRGYLSPDHFEILVKPLERAFLERALIRDLHNAHWREYVTKEQMVDAPIWASKMLEAFIQNKRLRPVREEKSDRPRTDSEWYDEAKLSNEREKLTGIIVAEKLNEHRGNVSSVRDLDDAHFWKDRHARVVKRTVENYIQELNLIIECANSFMLIEPNFMPENKRFSGFFLGLLEEIKKKNKGTPRIELHCKKKNFQNLGAESVKKFFDRHIGSQCRSLKMPISVFVRSGRPHDRYLITDIIAISSDNGFDVDLGQVHTTVWHRLTKEVADSVQRQYDCNSTDYPVTFGPLRIGE